MAILNPDDMPKELDFNERFEQALARVEAEKPTPCHVAIKIFYDKSLILPYHKGLQFLEAMGQAELLSEHYKEGTRIQPLDRADFYITFMSPIEYKRLKIATLMGITPEEVKRHMEQVVPIPF